MNTSEEILQKVCFILNLKEFHCQNQLLSDLDRLILHYNNKTALDNFIDDVSNNFPDVSFSVDFLSGIFELSTEEITFIFQKYFEHKRNDIK